MQSDTLTWNAAARDSTQPLLKPMRPEGAEEDSWLRAPFGEDLLTDLDRWRARGKWYRDDDLIVDYNRVDQLRVGLHLEASLPQALGPRIGARYEYAFGRDRSLYGVQIEQPLVAGGRFAIGGSFTRRTDHSELQQIEDAENSLAMLFGRQDFR